MTVADIVSTVIGSLALFLSLASWIRTLIKERFKIQVSCQGYQITKSDYLENYSEYVFAFIFDNLSSVPLSVSSISVEMTDGTLKTFDLTRRFIKEHFIPPGTERTYEFFSTDFPVNLAGNSSCLIFATFEKNDSAEVKFDVNSQANFLFHTNLKKKILSLYCPARNPLSF